MEGKSITTRICRPDDLPEEIRKQVEASPDHICCINDNIYLLNDQAVFCIPNNPGRNELVYALTGRKKSRQSRPESAKDLYERILTEPDYQPDPASLRAFGIKERRKRCCAVFRAYSPLQTDLSSVLSSVAPVESMDSVIPADYQTAVIIKDMEEQPADEIKEFCGAVIGTLTDEGINDIRAGIGRVCKGIHELRLSCLEGRQSLNLGVRYHRSGTVYTFKEQTLERIAESIPQEKKKMILHSFFGPDTDNVLSDEMLETIRVFFLNDLNLTAASKQLYIHRNTLNYRLDKIKKEFGLDLRSFNDAAVFRIMSVIMKE